MVIHALGPDEQKWAQMLTKRMQELRQQFDALQAEKQVIEKRYNEQRAKPTNLDKAWALAHRLSFLENIDTVEVVWRWSVEQLEKLLVTEGVESPTVGTIKSGPKNYQKTSTIAFLLCFA